jgi:hypothetical protein
MIPHPTCQAALGTCVGRDSRCSRRNGRGHFKDRSFTSHSRTPLPMALILRWTRLHWGGVAEQRG